MRRDPRFFILLIIIGGVVWLPLSQGFAKKNDPQKKLQTENSQIPSAPNNQEAEPAVHSAELVLNETRPADHRNGLLMADEKITQRDPVLSAVDPASSPADEDTNRLNPLKEWQEAAANDPTAPALTLADCYALALKQSEVIAINAELIREAEAHFLQSFGTLLPQVSFAWSQTNQDSEKAFSSFANNASHEGKFVFKQTLFSGFKEFSGMSGSRLEKSQFLEQKKRAEHLLFVDVADAFYLLLEQQEDLKTLETIRVALSDRISELKKREDIGRSRHSEVVNTEAQLYNIEAEIELSKSRKLIARELLEFLIGRPAGGILDQADTPNSLEEQAYYLAKSDLRPDVKAAEYAWGVAKKQVQVARSDLFPAVSVEGNYFTHRDTAPTDTTWSTVLKVDVPIFEGTTTYGTIKEKNALARQGELLFLRAKRLATQDVHDSYVRALAAMIRTQALDKALKAAELNYSLQRQDYQYNLVNNLEVLAAIQNLGNTRRSYIQTLYEKKRRFWELQAAIGDIETEQRP